MRTADSGLQEKLKEEHPDHPGRFQKLSMAICPKCDQQEEDSVQNS